MSDKIFDKNIKDIIDLGFKDIKMNELLEIIKKFEELTSRGHWLVFYTDGTIEIQNEYKCIISANSIEDAKKQCKDILNRIILNCEKIS